MSSSRLPGKVLLDLGGQPMLVRVIERVRHGGAFERSIKQILLTGSKCALVSRSSEPRYPSIEINAKTMTEKDGTIVRIVGLAIAVFIPLRTD